MISSARANGAKTELAADRAAHAMMLAMTITATWTEFSFAAAANKMSPNIT
jgi:hypothetical protein